MGIEVHITLLGTGIKNKKISLCGSDVEMLRMTLLELYRLPVNSYYCVSRGKLLSHIEHGESIEIVPRVCGGKGGFGSMLRAIGAQIEKTTNREACRDLSGRRLRDINEEQRLKKWISQQSDREQEAEERKKRKLERLASEPKHEFKDESYDKERSQLMEKLHDSLEQGLKAGTVKRKSDEMAPKKLKKKKTLLDIDELSSSDDSDVETPKNEEPIKQEPTSSNCIKTY